MHDITSTMSQTEFETSLAAAVKVGIQAAASDPAVWIAARAAVKDQATDAAGDMVLGGLKALAKRAFWLLVILAMVYQTFGWAAMVGAYKMLTAAGKV